VRLQGRPAAALLGVLALGVPLPARGGITGNLDVQGQVTQSVSRPVGGTAQTTAMTLLSESLSLHYAGLPFGPAVAVATAGGSFTHLDGWYGQGLRSSGQVLSFDASLGFLPRRAVPLRLYAGGSVVGGTSGALALQGPGPSLLYGGTLHLEPGRLAPGIRLDVSEARSTRPGLADLTDVQRRLSASAHQTLGGQRLQLGVLLERDHRQGAGDVTSWGATLDWSGTRHQTTFLATEVRRSLPLLSGITADRQAAASSEQRWGSSLSTQAAARLAEAEGGGATGRLGDARASFAWRALQGARQLTLSAGGNGGFTRTRSPTGDADGSSWGTSGRAAYGQVLGPLNGGLSVGAASNTCDCRFGSGGTARLLDATASLSLQPAARGSAQAEYTVARALAPLNRGGDRLENHARAFGWLSLAEATTLNGSLGWDDGQRELLDIVSGRAATLHERAASGSLGVSTRLGAVHPTAEVRHARNTVASDGSLFVAGTPTLVRSVTSVLGGATWNPRSNLSLLGQLRGSWATLSSAPDLTTLAASLSLQWRLGRLLVGLRYQGTRTRQGEAPAARQQTVMATLSRPFEI